MDKALRNTLRSVVTQCRKLLEEAVGEILQGQFGIHADGIVEDVSRLTHLSADDLHYREEVLAHLEHIRASGLKPKDATAQLIREAAFTHLNRLCAYKMMTSRGLIEDPVGKGLKSRGFRFYLGDHPDDEALYRGAKEDIAYRHYFDWLNEGLSTEIGVLFAREELATRLFPPYRVLIKVLDLINSEELAGIWTEDETIGWVYQYFTPKELRDQARKESAAPRNSYELAFRNQFYTPRYVVEFLVDNTLGRLWYEMRKGDTTLAEKCRYLVRLPNEIFLTPNEQPPDSTSEVAPDLPPEELLKQSVYVKYRQKKDPREIKILDPACGSGHFLLYCFGLLEVIYEEAYEDPELEPTLHSDYASLEDLKRDIPRLILEQNLHGIDIDLRSTQISALALWLRCQRAYKELGLENEARPRIRKTNIVCAEPMPGESELLEEFVREVYPPFLGDVVRVVFERMKLAGEAGSLLKIGREISGAIAEAKKHWRLIPQQQQLALFRKEKLADGKQGALFDFSGITDQQFWDEAEARVLESLREYAQRVGNNGRGVLRRLFAHDAARGFAFVDVCIKRFEIVLMNPPFGEPSRQAKEYLEATFPETKNDIFAMFVERFLKLLRHGGRMGVISNKTGFFLQSFVSWRKLITHSPYSLLAAADLGFGVLDSAVVETMAYTIGCVTNHYEEMPTPFIRVAEVENKEREIETAVKVLSQGNRALNVWVLKPKIFDAVPNGVMCYWASARVLKIFEECEPLAPNHGHIYQGIATGDNFRFLRNRWEVNAEEIGRRNWRTYVKGGESIPYYADLSLIVRWNDDGREIKERAAEFYGSASRTVKNEETFGKAGLTYTQVTVKGFYPRTMPAGSIYDMKGPLILPLGNDDSCLLLGVLGSLPIAAFTKMLTDSRQWHPTNLMYLPFPNLDPKTSARISEITNMLIEVRQSGDLSDETTSLFLSPMDHSSHVEDTSPLQTELDEMVSTGFGVGLNEFQQMNRYFSVPVNGDDEDNTEVSEATTNLGRGAEISYAIGCAFGRWDVRYGSGERPAPKLPDPFALLPVCAPGALTGEDGLPLYEAPGDYPLRIDAAGILVDEPTHTHDVVARVREVFELIWPKAVEAREREACELLGVKELRDYFRKPTAGGFWMDHVRRYSKSRRKAPIYWLLRSSKGNYAIWLYYHRLDKDVLYKALLNYVEPKLRLEENNLSQLRQRRETVGTTGREAKQLEKDLDKQESFISELHDFHGKLKRAADLHLEPDLNDGVVLNIAPLWELVPWTEAKKYWKELLEGKYEWSSISKQLRERGML